MMQRICRTAADGVHHYMKVSCELAYYMPEYYATSYVFSKLGGKEVCFTLETNVALLRSWNDQIYERAAIERTPSAPMPEERNYLLANRIDLVWYPENQNWAPPGAIWLIEFKRHKLSVVDRDKLLSVLPHLSRAAGGAVFSIVDAEVESDWLIREANDARSVGDTWYQCNVAAVPGVTNDRRFSVCGRGFMSPCQPWAAET